jgi:AAA domain
MSATPEDLAAARAYNRNQADSSGAEDQGEDLGEWDQGDDNDPIPPRQWLLSNQFCRGFLSSLLGEGAVGKTALRIAQLLSSASGRALLRDQVFIRAGVLIVCLEDGRDEIRRRVKAAMKHHGLTNADLRDYLFIAAPKGVKLAELRDDGSPAAGKLERMARKAFIRRQIDIVSFDPFVKLHSFEENNNTAIDFVAGLLAQMAIEFNIAVDAPHHTKKGVTAAGDAEAGRGASAFKDAGRLVYTLTRMATKDADIFGVIEAERRQLVRLDSAKVNLTPTGTEARWFKLVGVDLGNSTELYPHGDNVQTVEVWTPPDIYQRITDAVVNEILNRIDAGIKGGGRYSAEASAKPERAAWCVVQEHASHLSGEQCRKVISNWLERQVLVKRTYHDAVQRKDRLGLYVVDANRPGITHKE